MMTADDNDKKRIGYCGKILDTHSHFTIETSNIAEDAEEIGFCVENKSIEEHLAFMNRMGIDYSVISCPTVKYSDDRLRCREYCRDLNDAAAEAVRTYPGRLGFAASLPLPWTEEAVEELERAVQELGAKAVLMSSNYGGLYLGDPSIEPVFELLDQYQCPVLLHPTAPAVYPEAPVTGRILPMFEFIADTTRSLLDLFAAGTLMRYQNIRVVVPHSGSCLPAALDRFAQVMEMTNQTAELPMDRLYYDLACGGMPRGMSILMELTDEDHIMYGTDYPPVPEAVLGKELNAIKTDLETELDPGKVMWENAARLFHIETDGE